MRLYSEASDRPEGHEQGGGAVGGQEALQGVKFYLSFYSKPLEIVKGCSCKKKDKKCQTCNCKKMDLRDKKCTPLTCRFCGCFDREQTDDGNLSSSSTEFSSDTESDSMSEPLINYQRDIISKDHDDVSSDESDQMI